MDPAGRLGASPTTAAHRRWAAPDRERIARWNPTSSRPRPRRGEAHEQARRPDAEPGTRPAVPARARARTPGSVAYREADRRLARRPRSLGEPPRLSPGSARCVPAVRPGRQPLIRRPAPTIVRGRRHGVRGSPGARGACLGSGSASAGARSHGTQGDEALEASHRQDGQSDGSPTGKRGSETPAEGLARAGKSGCRPSTASDVRVRMLRYDAPSGAAGTKLETAELDGRSTAGRRLVPRRHVARGAPDP